MRLVGRDDVLGHGLQDRSGICMCVGGTYTYCAITAVQDFLRRVGWCVDKGLHFSPGNSFVVYFIVPDRWNKDSAKLYPENLPCEIRLLIITPRYREVVKAGRQSPGFLYIPNNHQLD